MYIRYAIDGATRRNGKPDCVASGAVIAQPFDNDGPQRPLGFTVVEHGSTNQRGEMLALLEALTHFCSSAYNECQIITDSEYLFNTVSKDWLSKWYPTWRTSSGNPVKNQDIWMLILSLLNKIEDKGKEVNIYHIKGHVMPFGKVTSQRLIELDDGCASLIKEVELKYDNLEIAPDKLQHLQELSVKNNGFELTEEGLKTFVTLNTATDLLAGYAVDKA